LGDFSVIAAVFRVRGVEWYICIWREKYLKKQEYVKEKDMVQNEK
jgi:hypothetical protein